MSNLDLEKWSVELASIVEEWLRSDYLKAGQLFVVGCSTSEVAGQRIGTSGSEEIATIIFDKIDQLKQQTGIEVAYQCCEHLNRAIVVERETAIRRGLTEVTAVPVPTAGGSMASYAFKQFQDPVLVESIVADAGMDIGETMIGMHLKPVAIPLRFKQRYVGHARVNTARTRPKLIGGKRAEYPDNQMR
ncbi:TIGR01440 family protein [Radiobacillus kanasensis]|uniref:TIGR01440 family protein n=1 Tax=Radiobacillus kanasensis TaxID=2844358 RepID=UPI001E4C662E|nr:TIGR01440 family protein [Radiobacillus kanasensis]UFT98954.1 TIGR01440 family protein [Radiobacillus kanasensis]